MTKILLVLFVFFARVAEGQVFKSISLGDRNAIVLFHEGNTLQGDITEFSKRHFPVEYLEDKDSNIVKDYILFIDQINDDMYILLAKTQDNFWERTVDLPNYDDDPIISIKRGMVKIEYDSAEHGKEKYRLEFDVSEKDCEFHPPWRLVKF